MNKLGRNILYALGVFAVYSLVVTYFQMPIFGQSLFFLLLLACPLMMVFMMGGHGHSGHSEKKIEGTH